MRSPVEVLRRESPVKLAGEALWRVKKRWGRRRFHQQIAERCCPVVYRLAGYYRPLTNRLCEQAQQAILRYADAVLAGEFPWFAYGPVQLGFPPRWNFDFVSGSEWPELQGDELQVVRYDGPDVKAPWELSRLQCLPVLGKAWRLTQDPAYRKAAQELLWDWITKNPTGVGVNWALAMEGALRAMSACFLLELLAPFRGDESAWVAGVTRSLWHHLLFIEAHREFSHLVRSNHYLSNLAGLLALTCSLEGPGMATRRRRYARQLQEEIFVQTYPDGGDHEASMGYHVFCTQLFTTGLLFLRARGLASTPRFETRLRKMHEVIAAVSSENGEAPNVGDCDDGRVELLTGDLRQMFFPVRERSSLAVGGLLGMGAALWGLETQGSEEDALWYGLRTPPRVPAKAGDPTVVFSHSGMGIARQAEAEALLFAMPNGIGGRGSHTHNDKLSAIVRLRGVELFTDSGTACYTRDVAMRNRFRATAAHNTLVVDGREQNRISTEDQALFRLGNEARVSPIETTADQDTTSLAAALLCGSAGWVHTRRIVLSSGRSVVLQDSLAGSGTHSLDLYFQLAPSWRPASITAEGCEAICRLAGLARVEVRCSGPAPVTARAEPTQQSRTYGATFHSVRLHFHTRVTFPAEIITRVHWD
jgi:hypothetical protein